MSDYRDWLTQFNDEDQHKAATKALNDLRVISPRTRSLLHPILVNAIIIARRNQTRAVEHSAKVRQVFTGQSTLEQRDKLLTERFALGDGRWVSWADATIEDHLARIRFLRAHIAGIEETISQHEAAIELIRQHGTTCLGEIGAAA